MLISIESFFDIECVVIELRYTAYDEDDPNMRASMLALAAAIELLWEAVTGEG